MAEPVQRGQAPGGWLQAVAGTAGERASLRSGALACAVTGVGALLEAIGLQLAGLRAALPLAPQAVGLPAVAAFHDAGWILVYGTSWPAVAGEAVASVGLRALVLAVLVRQLWPTGGRPALGAVLPRAVVASAICLVALSPFAALAFVGGIVSLSFPILGAVAGTAVTAVLLLPHAGVTARWWAAFPPWRAMAWTAVSLVVATVAAVAVAASPGWVAVPVAGLGGAAGGWCWRGVVAASAGAGPGRLRASSAVVPLATVGGVALTVVLLAAALGSLLETAIPHRRYEEALPRHGQHVVVEVDGFESDWNGAPPAVRFPGFYVTEFSYRGLARSGRALPYESRFTDRPLPVLAARMARQFNELYRKSGHRLDVLAVSEGTLVLREYLAEHPHPPLRTVVLASPLPRPDRVVYPPVDAAGWGMAGGFEAGLLTGLVDLENHKAGIGPSIPMVRSLVAQPGLFRQRSLCPVRGVRVLALLPLSSAVADPPGPVSGVPDVVLPAVHAGLLSLGTTRRLVGALFRGHRLPRGGLGWGLAYQLTRFASAAWESPPLPLAELSGTGAGPRRGLDAAFDTYGCPAADRPGARAS